MRITDVIAEKAKPRLRMGFDKLLAAAQEAQDWKDWYRRHEPLIHEMFGDEAVLFKALLAATSQRAVTHTNVGLALKAYKQLKGGLPFTGYLPSVIANLDRIRANEVLVGRKIGEFGGAMDDTGGGDNIAVDQHIGELMFGTPRPTAAQVRKAKEVIFKIAQKLGWQPREVQASLWAYNQLVRGEKPRFGIGSYAAILEKKREEIRLIRQAFMAISREEQEVSQI